MRRGRSRLAAGLVLWACLAAGVRAERVTEILYDDREADGTAYVSRILVAGERLRMDYGRDEEDFILYDRPARAVYLVSHAARRVMEIPAGKARVKTPKGWRVKLDTQTSAGQHLTQARLNDKLCAEFKNADLLPEAARLLADFRQALAANQAAAWEATPEEMRDGCLWLMDVKEAGVEYRRGLLLALRQADGRSRVYRSHAQRDAPDGLFALPGDYARVRVGGEPARGGGKAGG